MALKVGDRVYHGPHGHGKGTIIEVRESDNQTEEYLKSKGFTSFTAEQPGIAALALAVNAYPASRYPYRVKFDDGYTDVYSGEPYLGVVLLRYKRKCQRVYDALMSEEEEP